uniref:Uncharacterized protein n=1 Tax=Anguilla anguilla TaxID=7936 RepID=A0A0E9XJG6_ANGAN
MLCVSNFILAVDIN